MYGWLVRESEMRRETARQGELEVSLSPMLMLKAREVIVREHTLYVWALYIISSMECHPETKEAHIDIADWMILQM